MKHFGAYRLLQTAALFALCALVLILWPFFDKRPIVLIFGLSVGQAIGTTALLVFLSVVLTDLRRKNVLGHPSKIDSLKPKSPPK